MMFAEEMASLLKSGLNLEAALEIQADVAGRSPIKNVIHSLINDIRAGSSFAEALRHHPKVFPKLFISMVRAGEESGTLEVVMERVAGFLRRSHELRSAIYSAMIYPVILAIAGLASLAVLMTYVVPKFVVALKSASRAKPWSTAVLIGISDFISAYWWGILLGVFIVLATVILLRRVPAGRRFWDSVKLRVPLVGNLIVKFETSRVSGALGTLFGSGVATLTALDIAAEVCANRFFSEAVRRVAGKVRDGESLSLAFGAEKVFPSVAAKMAKVGEESGTLAESFSRLSVRLEQEAHNSMKRAIVLLEPALIIVMGLVVGFVVLAIISAIFSVNTL